MQIAVVALCTFVLALVFGRLLIPTLRALKAGQSIREIGPSWHNSKAGTPTMGGIMFIAAAILCVVAAWAGAVCWPATGRISMCWPSRSCSA